jgi:hypothetical protein
MATPADKDSLDNINKINESAKTLANTYKQIEQSTGRLNADQKETLDIAKSLVNVSSEIGKSINLRISGEAKSRDIAKQIKALTQNQLNQNGELNKLADNSVKANITKRITQQQLVKATREQVIAEEALGQKASQVADIQNKIQNYEAGIIQARLSNNNTLARTLTHLKNQASLTLTSAKQAERDAKEDLKNKNKALNITTKISEEAKKQSKIAYDAKKAYEAAIDAQKQELELLNKAKVIAQGKEVLDVLTEKFNVKQIKDMFTLVGIIRLIVDASLLFNKISTDISKNFAYTTSEADRLTYDLLNAAQNSDNLNVTLKNAAEAMGQLNEQTGFVAEYSADALETQIMLTKQFRLTADEAAGVYKLSVLNGKSSEQINQSMVSAFVASRNQLKVGIPFKTTMAEAAKVSGQLAANLKNNPEFIVKAVAQAKALGITLEQTKRQGELLLDFESSIESELKAELLTGQALNLERARAAALMGDQVTVMKELADQGMTLEKFQNMNVLAQKSFAAAIGLSSDELANQLTKQKLAVESGKSLAQLTEEEALEAQKRQTIQDKFNAGIDKLKDIIGNLLSGPVSQLLDILTDVLQVVTFIGKPFAVINKLIDKITGSAKGLGSVLKGILGIVAAIAIWSNPLMALGTLAIAGGVIAGAQALIPNMAEGGVVPATPGGKIVRVAEAGQSEAIIPLNKMNNIVAPQQDNSALISAINRQTDVISSKNYNPILKTMINGNEIATTTAQGSYNLA